MSGSIGSENSVRGRKVGSASAPRRDLADIVAARKAERLAERDAQRERDRLTRAELRALRAQVAEQAGIINELVAALERTHRDHAANLIDELKE